MSECRIGLDTIDTVRGGPLSRWLDTGLTLVSKCRNECRCEVPGCRLTLVLECRGVGAVSGQYRDSVGIWCRSVEPGLNLGLNEKRDAGKAKQAAAAQELLRRRQGDKAADLLSKSKYGPSTVQVRSKYGHGL